MAESSAGGVAFACPGVGVALTGREKSVVREHPELFDGRLEAASDGIGIDLRARLFADRIDDLDGRAAQHFSYGFSVGLGDLFAERLGPPDCVAGYSFGVYAALCLAGAFDFDTGLTILDHAQRLMAEQCRGEDLDLGVLVGPSPEEVARLLERPKHGRLVLANSNNPTCQVVAGPVDELEPLFAAVLEGEAIAASRLGVGVPYHHPVLLGEASRRFAEVLRDLPLHNAPIPLISTIDQRPMTAADELRVFLAANLSTPIHWAAVLAELTDRKVTRIAECGPGISLTQNGRFGDGPAEYYNVKNWRRRLG